MIRGVKRPCVQCGALIDNGSRCRKCALPPLYTGDWAARSRAVRAGATCCYWCKGPFTVDNPAQADHLTPGDPGSVLVAACRRCNAGRGN